MIRSNLAIDAGRSFGFGVGEARACGGMLMPRFASLRRRAAPSLLERASPVRVMRRDIGRTLGATSGTIDGIGRAWWVPVGKVQEPYSSVTRIA